MKQLKRYILVLFLLTSCQSEYLVNQDNQNASLQPNEGYLGLVINSLDSLYSIQIRTKDNSQRFYIGVAEKGNTLKILKLPEGEYCFSGFSVYSSRFAYDDEGFCTYVEADELNYFTTFYVRNPITTTRNNYNLFVKLLRDKYPILCEEYIGENCN